MGKFFPVTVAFILLAFGVQIFREPNKVGTGPLIATYIFIFASYLLLWDIRLYPVSLRRLGTGCQCLVEKIRKKIGPTLISRANLSLLECVRTIYLFSKYLIATFLFENILIDFWFPLEIVFIGVPSKVAAAIESVMSTGKWQCPGWLCGFLKADRLKLVVSYVVSLFFLIAVLQATRAIDLRELEGGIGPFFSDIAYRIERSLKRTGRSLGFGKKRRVKIKESKSSKKSFTRSTPRNPGLADVGPDEEESIDKENCNADELRRSFSDFEKSLNKKRH